MRQSHISPSPLKQVQGKLNSLPSFNIFLTFTLFLVIFIEVHGEEQMVAPVFAGEESPDTTGQGAP